MDAAKLIDKEIARHPDWRGQIMTEIRATIRETVPDVTEELKWMGTPTWSHNGILCICNAFKDMVKVTFYNGAKLGLDQFFNAELGGKQWRAIKLFQGDRVNVAGLKTLLLAAVALNADKPPQKSKPQKTKKAPAKVTKTASTAPKATSRTVKSKRSKT